MNKVKSIKTEEFKKIANTKLYTIKIEVLGNEELRFKSKDQKKITEKMIAVELLYGSEKVQDNRIEITLDEYDCKDTFDVDENHVYTGLSCYRGEYI